MSRATFSQRGGSVVIYVQHLGGSELSSPLMGCISVCVQSGLKIAMRCRDFTWLTVKGNLHTNSRGE